MKKVQITDLQKLSNLVSVDAPNLSPFASFAKIAPLVFFHMQFIFFFLFLFQVSHPLIRVLFL